MSLNNNDLAEMLSTTLDNANGIVDAARNRETPTATSSQPDSLIIAYARGLLNDCQQYKHIASVAVIRAGLNADVQISDGRYVGSANINRSGYNVYIINQGQITNNGERGFTSWTVVGNSRQNNNVITIPA